MQIPKGAALIWELALIRGNTVIVLQKKEKQQFELILQLQKMWIMLRWLLVKVIISVRYLFRTDSNI